MTTALMIPGINSPAAPKTPVKMKIQVTPLGEIRVG